MKLNGQIITSLNSFRLQFNLFEIWRKRNIFVRDLSPAIIFYNDENDKIYYNTVVSPSLAKFTNQNEIVVGDLHITITKEEGDYIKDFQIEEKIQIIALTRLAKKSIPKEICHFSSVTKNNDTAAIELSYGESLAINPITIEKGVHLQTKMITVNSDSKMDSMIGKNYLHPGQTTYGVFVGDDLVCVCPQEESNSLYRLSFHKTETSAKLVVTDRTSDMVLLEYPNAHWFVKINDNNFALIDGKSVLCINNEDLNRRVRGIVERSFSPTILKCDSKYLYVIYADGSEEKIIL